MPKKNFYKNYFEIFKSKISFSEEILKKIEKIKKIIMNVKKNNKKILIFGNGGSAAIASHFSIDCNNMLKIRCLNFNEASILTCYSNDYGYENWVKKALEQFSEKGDLAIFISSSGESKNMINGSSFLKNRGVKTVTLTGFNQKNSLQKSGGINIWINSNIYNFIENSHQLILLSIMDSLSNIKIK